MNIHCFLKDWKFSNTIWLRYNEKIVEQTQRNTNKDWPWMREVRLSLPWVRLAISSPNTSWNDASPSLALSKFLSHLCQLCETSVLLCTSTLENIRNVLGYGLPHNLPSVRQMPAWERKYHTTPTTPTNSLISEASSGFWRLLRQWCANDTFFREQSTDRRQRAKHRVQSSKWMKMNLTSRVFLDQKEYTLQAKEMCFEKEIRESEYYNWITKRNISC